jgi:hypothetical protein
MSIATRKLLWYLIIFVRMVLRLCDELDKSEDLHQYFTQLMSKYINENIIPKFDTLRGMDLL